MKTHAVVALIGLATGFVAPAFTQEKTTVDPKIRQQIEAINTKYDEAFDKRDAAAIATLYTTDAVLLTQNEVFSGREAIEKRYKSILEGSSFSDHISKLDQIGTAFGVYTWAIGSWTVKSGSQDYKGFGFSTYLPEGDTWKISRQVALY